jgi:hypothetical protein
MGFIKLENLIGTMSPDQQILAQSFYAKFNNNSGLHKLILNVEPIFLNGSIATSELLLYSVNKMYLCFSLQVSIIAANLEVAAPAIVNLHDETDTIINSLHNNAGFFNATEKIFANTIEHYNDIFSHIDTTGYTYLRFAGYRVTLD